MHVGWTRRQHYHMKHKRILYNQCVLACAFFLRHGASGWCRSPRRADMSAAVLALAGRRSALVDPGSLLPVPERTWRRPAPPRKKHSARWTPTTRRCICNGAPKIVSKKLRKHILTVMDLHPETLPDIKRCLEQLGYTLEDRGRAAKVEPANKTPRKAMQEEEDEAAGEEFDEQGEAPENPEGETGDLAETGGTGAGGVGESRLRGTLADPDPSHWAPHRYTRLDNASVPLISNILAQVEPISLSLLALRAVMAKGDADCSGFIGGGPGGSHPCEGASEGRGRGAAGEDGEDRGF